MKSENIKRKSLTQQVAEALREQILAGEYQQGQQLRQSEIAGKFGVSQIPVREAFQLLEAEGLVKNVPYKGAIVSRLAVSEIAEYFDIRSTLESELLGAAIGHLGPDDLARARAAYEASLTATPEAWGECNWELHEAIYLAAKKPITLDMVKKIHDNLDRYVRIQLSLSEENRIRANEEHLRLIELCEAGKRHEAVGLLQDHVAQAKDDLLKHLSEGA